MKHATILALALLLTLSTACKETGSEKAEGDGNGNSLDNLKKEAGDVIEAGKEVGKDALAALKKKKEEFLEKHQDDFAEIDSRIAEFEQRAAAAKDDAKAALKAQVEKLKEKKAAAKEKLAELREQAPDAWEKFKGGAGEAMDELKQAVKDAKAEFDEKEVAADNGSDG